MIKMKKVHLVIVLILTFSAIPYVFWGQDHKEEIRCIKGDVSKVLYVFPKNHLRDIKWKYRYTINDSDNIVRQKNYYKTRLGFYKHTVTYTFDFDNQKNKIKETIISASSNKNMQQFFIDYLYDNQGRVQRKVKYGSRNHGYSVVDSINYDGLNPTSWKECFYNNEERILFVKTNSITYDSLARIKQKNIKEEDGSGVTYSYEYNQQGEVNKRRTTWTTVLKANSPFVIRKPFSQDVQKKYEHRIWEYRYDYDDRNNWIRRYAKYNNGEEYLDVIRKIQYR